MPSNNNNVSISIKNYSANNSNNNTPLKQTSKLRDKIHQESEYECTIQDPV
jgi:hypothetical protein